MDVPGGWDGILEPGERVLWQDQPRGAPVWQDLDPRQTVFGLAITAFALFWTGAVLQAGPPGLPGILMPLGGLFFLGLGLKTAGGHLFWDAYRRRHTWYTLTDRRAIIATDLAGRRRMTSYPIAPDTPLRFAGSDPGHIWFATTYRRTARGSARRPVGFEHVRDARRVYDLMRRVQRETLDDSNGRHD